MRVLAALVVVAACSGPSRTGTSPAAYDVVIRGGTVYDGSGGPGGVADLAVTGDRIAAIGDLRAARGRIEIEARGLAVSPGFINMLSWANETLFEDGRGESDIRQGVTLEVFGEGRSMGPLTDELARITLRDRRAGTSTITWRTLDEGLVTLERRGVSPNIASFVGAMTLRMNVIGEDDRAPTAAELDQMRALVDQAMRDGAVGVGAALYYAPSFFAKTDELVALAEVASRHGGMFTAHMRSEGDRLLEAIDEMIDIARRAHVRTEIYHLKAAGERNWDKLEPAIAKIEAARAEGLPLTADMYLYTAAGTGLASVIPRWAQDGDKPTRMARLRDPDTRKRIVDELSKVNGEIRITHAKNTTDVAGSTLAEIATRRNVSLADAVIDLVLENESDIGAMFPSMSEDNVRRIVTLPWVSFGSDGGAVAPGGTHPLARSHPRAYGNFARLLGRYVRDEKLVPLAEAIRRLTSLPATNLRLDGRGTLRPGNYADVVVFDPSTVIDHATYVEPDRLATGVMHVLVNGVPVLRDGEHTGAKPGRVVRGPGYRRR